MRQYHHSQDRCRAILSRLLQVHCCSLAMGLPRDQIVLARTRGRKPFLAFPAGDRSVWPNFNYSVSHDGDYVAIAAEPLLLVGCDVCCPSAAREARHGCFMDFASTLRRQLHQEEWLALEQCSSEQEKR